MTSVFEFDLGASRVDSVGPISCSVVEDVSHALRKSGAKTAFVNICPTIGLGKSLCDRLLCDRSSFVQPRPSRTCAFPGSRRHLALPESARVIRTDLALIRQLVTGAERGNGRSMGAP